MSLAFLFHYLMLNMFWMLIHPSSGACDLFVELFHGLYCSGSMRVGVLSVCRLKPSSRYRTTPTKPQDDARSNKHNVHIVFGSNPCPFFKLYLLYAGFRPLLCPRGQSFWLQIQRSWVRSPALPNFLSSSGSGTGSTQSREPREVN